MFREKEGRAGQGRWVSENGSVVTGLNYSPVWPSLPGPPTREVTFPSQGPAAPGKEEGRPRCLPPPALPCCAETPHLSSAVPCLKCPFPCFPPAWGKALLGGLEEGEVERGQEPQFSFCSASNEKGSGTAQGGEAMGSPSSVSSPLDAGPGLDMVSLWEPGSF